MPLHSQLTYFELQRILDPEGTSKHTSFDPNTYNPINSEQDVFAGYLRTSGERFTHVTYQCNSTSWNLIWNAWEASQLLRIYYILL